MVSWIRWNASSKHFAFLPWSGKNGESEQSFKYVFMISTDYDMILKVVIVFTIVPFERILILNFYACYFRLDHSSDDRHFSLMVS